MAPYKSASIPGSSAPHSAASSMTSNGTVPLHMANYGQLLRRSCIHDSLVPGKGYRFRYPPPLPPGRIPALSVGCVAVCPPPPQAVSWLPRPLTSQSSAAAETLKTHRNVDYTCLFRWKFSYIITLSYVPASAFASVCVFNLQWTSDNNSYISSCLYFSFVVAFPGLLLHCWAGSTATLI